MNTVTAQRANSVLTSETVFYDKKIKHTHHQTKKNRQIFGILLNKLLFYV